MDENQFVPLDKFFASSAAQFALIQQLMSLVGALSKALVEKGIVTADLLTQHYNEAQQSEQAKIVREAIEKLRGYGPLEDILKGFSGPLQ